MSEQHDPTDPLWVEADASDQEAQTARMGKLVDGWPPRDRTGMIQPHRFNAITLFRAVPGIVGAFKTVVPDEFWNIDTEAEDEGVAVIACPCGEAPQAKIAELTECACGRFYLGMGSQVRVFNPDVQADRSES